MAHFWINDEVHGAKARQVHADSYVIEDEYIHFLDEDERKVMSIRKDIAFLIQRSDG
ncbi:hypothetical protein OHA61_25465 [Streptomyces sp. NBC_00885]|uniref:hypothetical protein n=1 Tax=Streptomyces sp. NBC_00885 TaxID=2975857 RepID=UPI00387001CE|nr:hypothetical protein OHA61_25465 [Streptomyces sp. NBC_00885]